MIRMLDRYVSREFLRLFVVFVLCAPVLFILGDITDNLDNYFDRGLGLGPVALSYVYQLPLFILYSFPIAGLIATIFTVSNLTRHHEIAAGKAGGVSFHRFVAPLAILGVLLSGAAVGLSELVPIANQKRAEVLGETSRTRETRSNFVYRSRAGYTFAIRRLDVEEGRISGLTVERQGDEEALPSLHLVADRATYRPDTGWTVYDGHLRFLLGDEGERTFRFEALNPVRFDEDPEQLLAEPKEPEEMGYVELGEFIEVIERSGGRPLELRVERAQKIALPLATFIIILFAAPLANAAPRSGTAYGIGISLGVTIVYLMLFKIAGAAGASGALPPLVAAWLPNGIFAAAAAVLVARVRT